MPSHRSKICNPANPGEVMTCLYRLYDVNNRLLYIGIAEDFDVRFKQHARDKDWWPQVARKDITWFDNRVDALHAEARAIANECPIYNRSPGAHPIGLRVIYRRPPRPYSVPRDWNFSDLERELQLGKYGKRKICEEIERFRSHALVTTEGVPHGVAVPIDWYLRARAASGDTTPFDDLPRVDMEALFWGPYDLTNS